MAVNRQAARRRVKVITGGAAAGAIALTAGFAFGASRGPHAAHARATASAPPNPAPGQVPQQVDPQEGFILPSDSSSETPSVPPGAGTQPPSSSQSPPAAVSGGS